MTSSVDILQLPVEETKDVSDLVNWFEKEKLHELNYPVIQIPEWKTSSSLYLVGLYLAIGMAFLILEEKGKLKVHGSKKDQTPNDFLIKLKNCKSESSLENLIEKRYHVQIAVQSSKYPTIQHAKPEEYTLNDVFGIWKGGKGKLDKARQEQWGREK